MFLLTESKAVIFSLSWSALPREIQLFRYISVRIILFSIKARCSQHIGTKTSWQFSPYVFVCTKGNKAPFMSALTLTFHNKTSVLVFMDRLLNNLSKNEGIKNIDIFWDGPSSQFKNQYVLNYLPMLLKQYGMECLNWHFFATSHGKGAVGGIGGTVKRQVWMQTLSREAVVNFLEDFCKVAKSKTQKIEIHSFSSEEIKTASKELHLHDMFSFQPQSLE